MIPSHLYLVCCQLWLLFAGWSQPGYWRVMKNWRTFAVTPVHQLDGVIAQSVPSTCPLHFDFQLHRRGLC